MSLFRIAWRSIQQRGLASVLTAVSMALGVMLVVSVLLILGVVSESFRSNSSLGYNMIVGAKGGRLQLVLNTVYYLSAPVENIPYAYYQEFLSAAERADGRDGRFKPLTQLAIPICMGDYYQGYRVVGTTPAMFDGFVYDQAKGRQYEFASGRNFHTFSQEHGFFEAVVGARVARDTGLKVGDRFSPTHGPEGDAHDDFFVVGILEPTGTPNDRAVFVNMEGFLLLEGHAKPVPSADAETHPQAIDAGLTSAAPADAEQPGLPAAQPPQTGADPPPPLGVAVDPAVSRLEAERQRLQPLPLEQREVTAILLRTVNPLVTPGLRNTINEGTEAQAVLPIAEIFSLFQYIVDPIRWVLLAITVMICVASGISILVSIYNSMSDRRHEIAVMRALGASRRTIMIVVLLESIMISLAGGMLGWMAGHGLVGGLASRTIEDRTGVKIGLLDVAPPVSLDALAGGDGVTGWGVSSEFLLIPGLILLAVIVGFLPALAAYRTDVARALSANP